MVIRIEYKSVKFVINLLFGVGGTCERRSVNLKPYMTLFCVHLVYLGEEKKGYEVISNFLQVT